MTSPDASDAQFTDDGSLILHKVKFDPRLKTYAMLQVMGVLCITFFGIPIAIIWALVGRPIHQRQYDAMECELTERTLNYRKGFLFRVQKNVPLDKITDLALNEGPILRYFGLCSLTVETAGGGGAAATGQASLVGVMDPIEFRNAVMRQRDLVVGGGVAVAAAPASGGEDSTVLEDIRDSLGRIEQLLASKNDVAK
jgi:membrane protein YdbS with pleckstrin-like domain